MADASTASPTQPATSGAITASSDQLAAVAPKATSRPAAIAIPTSNQARADTIPSIAKRCQPGSVVQRAFVLQTVAA